ncbi:MAG: phosphate/phosphite/phosphonate ABC transporter substrate-binding protein [Burkholderiales bacterium]
MAVFLTLAAAWPLLSSPVRAQSFDLPPYRFGVLPLQSPNKLAAMFLPLTKVLEERLHRRVQFVTAPSFSAYMQRVARREYDFLYLNPLLCGQARQSGYHVVAKVAGEPFTGILVVRRDSRITEIDANRLPPGMRLGFPDPGAYAATVMTRRYLENRGIPVDKFFQVKYFGSQDSALMALYSGLVDIAGTWKPSLRSMPKDIQHALRIVAETPPQPQMPIAVRDDTPADDAQAVAEVLVGLSRTAEGRRILRGMELPQGFVASGDGEYAGVGK